MKSDHKSTRIGFALNSIHYGSSLKLWRKLANYAQQEEGSFFIFPGGELTSKNVPANLRNSIYPLVNTENLDGLICKYR